MTDLSDHNPRRASFLPHDGEELRGHAPPDACTPEVARCNADQAIREVLLEQRRETSRKSLPDIAPVGADVAAPATADDRHEGAVSPQPDTADPVATPAAAPRRRLGSLLARAKAARPPRRLIWLVALAGIVIWRPLFLPMLVLAVLLLGLIAYLTLGPERFGEIAHRRWDSYARRRPERAARLRRKADELAMKWDRVLDWLPERWADRLALPDVASAAQEQVNLDEAPDPFDRLTARSPSHGEHTAG